MQKKVSIIIPTFNQKENIIDCITSIYSQSYKNLEIIIVDNNSQDGSADAIGKNFPKVILLRNKTNEGVTGAVLKGLKKSSGYYICFVDHDMVLDKKMIHELVKLIESDKKIGEVVGKIFYDEDKTHYWAAGTEINLFTGQIHFRGGKDHGQYDAIQEVQVAPANFLLKKSFIDAYGAYDPIYIIGYEDTDLSFKVRKNGYKVMYTPKAIAYHRIPLYDADASKRLLKRSYWIARNRIIFMKRWGHFGVFLSFMPIFFVYYLFLALQYNDMASIRIYIRGVIDGIKEK